MWPFCDIYASEINDQQELGREKKPVETFSGKQNKGG